VTADVVATVSASARFPVAQLEIRAAAATAALGWGAEGTGAVVFGTPVVVVVDLVVVVVDPADAASPLVPPRCISSNATPLAAIAARTRA
jgi:hypothetical protein